MLYDLIMCYMRCYLLLFILLFSLCMFVFWFMFIFVKLYVIEWFGFIDVFMFHMVYCWCTLCFNVFDTNNCITTTHTNTKQYSHTLTWIQQTQHQTITSMQTKTYNIHITHHQTIHTTHNYHFNIHTWNHQQ